MALPHGVLSMRPHFVLVEGGPLSEVLPTLIAFVWFFSSMISFMSYQVGMIRISTSAFAAFERPVAGMKSFMASQI